MAEILEKESSTFVPCSGFSSELAFDDFYNRTDEDHSAEILRSQPYGNLLW